MHVNVLTEDLIEPFVFDVENAQYLLQSRHVDLGAIKHAFRKNPKSEILTMHVMRDKMVVQG